MLKAASHFDFIAFSNYMDGGLEQRGVGVGEHSYSINSLTADLQGEFYDAIMTLTLEGFLYKTCKTQSCSCKSQPHKPEEGDCLRFRK